MAIARAGVDTAATVAAAATGLGAVAAATATAAANAARLATSGGVTGSWRRLGLPDGVGWIAQTPTGQALMGEARLFRASDRHALRRVTATKWHR